MKSGTQVPTLRYKAWAQPWLLNRAADFGPYNPSSIPLGEKKENKQKEAGVGTYLKKHEHSKKFKMKVI